MRFFLEYLQTLQKAVHLHCVFHSIRFKVNKGWSKALLLFLCRYPTYYTYEWHFDLWESTDNYHVANFKTYIEPRLRIGITF